MKDDKLCLFFERVRHYRCEFAEGHLLIQQAMIFCKIALHYSFNHEFTESAMRYFVLGLEHFGHDIQWNSMGQRMAKIL